MKHFPLVLKISLVVSLLIGTTGFASEKDFPVIKGEKIVATVNDESITLEDFNQELASLSAGKTEDKEAHKKNESKLLSRLINTKLIVQEARRIGLDELPEIKNMVDVFSKVTLRELLIERQLKNVKPDEKDVERFYKEFVKEWKIKSVIFEKEDAAKEMEEEIKEGSNFDELAKRVVADGIAKGGEEGNYFKGKDLLPQIAQAVSKMEVGSISPLIRVGTGFVILRVEDIRYPENPEAKEWARREAVNLKKEQVLRKYNDALIKKYAKVHKETLGSLDYESKEPGFQKLLEDKRVVAEIKGEKPITVSELTDYLRQQFYHGVERAIESKNLNERKVSILEEMLHKRVFRKEALRLAIDKTGVYNNKVKEYENSVIFGAFVQKVIVPDVKLNEEEIKTYYDEHIGEYTFPEMMKIHSLAFVKRNDAEDAIEKLRNGTEFEWLMANAEGQVNKNAKNLLSFEGNLLTVKSLPEGVQKVVSGARSGDLRLYESPEGYFHVLAVKDMIPAKPQLFEEAKKKIAKIVFDDKLKKGVEEWAEKLRAVSDVKVYLKDN